MIPLKSRTWATDDGQGVVSWRALMSTRSAELVEYHSEMERRQLRQGTIDKRMSVLARC